MKSLKVKGGGWSLTEGGGAMTWPTLEVDPSINLPLPFFVWKNVSFEDDGLNKDSKSYPRSQIFEYFPHPADCLP